MTTPKRFLMLALAVPACFLAFNGIARADPPTQSTEVHFYRVLTDLPSTYPIDGNGQQLASPLAPQGTTDGHWAGGNSTGKSMSFNVTSGGSLWNNFDSVYYINNGVCYGTIELVAYGPASISNNHFSASYGGGIYTFSGQFNSPTSATGSFGLNHYFLDSYCGYATLSGSWSATTAAPPPPTPTPPPPPGAFGKINPANGATGQPSTLTLVWSSSSAATSYAYCIDTSNNSNCDTGWKNAGTATSVQVSGLKYSTTYYWQVRANNSSGTTEASGGWWSLTTLKPPLLFGKKTPGYGATAQSINSTLSWWSSGAAASYDYCIDTSDNNACDTAWKKAGLATSIQLKGLQYSTTYYWQVRASNAAGVTDADQSTWWHFTTQIAPPGAFDKGAPLHGTAALTPTVTLSWADSARAASYEYCLDPGKVDNNNCDTGWKKVGAATSISLSGLKFNTTYFWQVRAVNSTAKKEANGGWWKFSTETSVEDNSTIQYAGWRGVADKQASGRTYRVTKVLSDTLTLNFTGPTVAWVTLKGPDQGQAQMLIDGIVKGTFDNYAATRTYGILRSLTKLGNRAHTLTIQVLGTQNAKASDANVVVDSFVVGTTTTQDNSSAITFNSWTTLKDSQASGKAFHLTDAAGAVAQFSFSGTSIDWVTALGPGYGQANVLIDGVQQGSTIDLYAATQQWQAPISFTGLSDGAHTLQIQVLGTSNPSATGAAVVVDAFRGPITVTSTTGSVSVGADE